eukprot:3858699-Pleurochrysis_carterae.AAC.3
MFVSCNDDGLPPRILAQQHYSPEIIAPPGTLLGTPHAIGSDTRQADSPPPVPLIWAAHRSAHRHAARLRARCNAPVSHTPPAASNISCPPRTPIQLSTRLGKRARPPCAVIEEQRLPEWADGYVDYKALKKTLSAMIENGHIQARSL